MSTEISDCILMNYTDLFTDQLIKQYYWFFFNYWVLDGHYEQWSQERLSCVRSCPELIVLEQTFICLKPRDALGQEIMVGMLLRSLQQSQRLGDDHLSLRENDVLTTQPWSPRILSPHSHLLKFLVLGLNI